MLQATKDMRIASVQPAPDFCETLPGGDYFCEMASEVWLPGIYELVFEDNPIAWGWSWIEENWEYLQGSVRFHGTGGRNTKLQ
jgi:hypothetical protein